jgi:predicted Zn-dependent protease
VSLCSLDAGEPDLAMEALRRARRAAPDDENVAWLLSDAYLRAGRRTEALRLLEGHLRRSADPPAPAFLDRRRGPTYDPGLQGD